MVPATTKIAFLWFNVYLLLKSWFLRRKQDKLLFKRGGVMFGVGPTELVIIFLVIAFFVVSFWKIFLKLSYPG